ncbi:MAG: hypothetical protein ACYDCL_01440 [Myxococcales bacterium]
MRRRSPQPSRAESLRQLEGLVEAQSGLRLLLAKLPPGATLDDARRLREKILQTDRRPCSFLDGPLGIRR